MSLPPDFWHAFGRRLYVTRLALELGEREAAAACGVSVRSYRRWEAGRPASNSARPVVAFCSRFAVSPDWLLLGQRHLIGRHLRERSRGKVAIL